MPKHKTPPSTTDNLGGNIDNDAHVRDVVKEVDVPAKRPTRPMENKVNKEEH